MQRKRAEGRNESAKGRPSKELNDRRAWRAELEFIRARMALSGGDVGKRPWTREDLYESGPAGIRRRRARTR